MALEHNLTDNLKVKSSLVNTVITTRCIRIFMSVTYDRAIELQIDPLTANDET